MNKKLYLMSEVELKAFFDCSNDLREAALTMSPKDVKAHTEEILKLVQINELVKGEKLNLEVDIDGVAHIPIQGMLTNNVSPSAGWFGEFITTYDFLHEAIHQAEEITAVKEITFEINSGGGEVDGLEAVANAIFNTRKTTTARIHGMAASAAFWLASQTNRIVATGRTSSSGSIGVAAEFIDRSAQDKAQGKKRIILTSTDAPEKRLDITTAEGQQQTINRLDEIHNVFVDHIVRGISSRNPTISPEFVNKNFGKGSVMAADAALQIGMIDEIESVSSQLIELTSKLQTNIPKTPTPPQTNEENMTLTEFLAQDRISRDEYDAAIATAKSEGKEELKTELKALSEEVKPIMASAAYKQRIKTAGFEVMTGERTKQSFMDMVAVVDENNESDKSDKIKTDQPETTLGEGGTDKATMAAGQTKANAEALSEEINNTNKVT